MSALVLTRRDLLKAGAGAAVAALAPEALAQEKPRRARVVLVRHRELLDARGKIHENVLMQMLDEAVCALLGVKTAVEAWKRLVKPTDLVGIKSNVWTPLPTPKEVERAIQKRLTDAGVAEGNIRIDDRGARQTLAGCTALINVRPVRTHWWSGIGGCIKNYIMFSDNPASHHPDACSSLASVWQLPAVRGKTRLNILLAFTPLFHGRGPHHWDPRYVWQYKGLFVSLDPVAVDAMGLKLIQAKRRQHFGEDVALETPPTHIRDAEVKYGLGVSDPARIELVKLGWKEEILL
ncbi:MAG: DUF362 domain-containing protein [Armatimonadetes bacterium]|nr:DUF362 domain-containing protein [Armatimonadota bacterium]